MLRNNLHNFCQIWHNRAISCYSDAEMVAPYHAYVDFNPFFYLLVYIVVGGAGVVLCHLIGINVISVACGAVAYDLRQHLQVCVKFGYTKLFFNIGLKPAADHHQQKELPQPEQVPQQIMTKVNRKAERRLKQKKILQYIRRVKVVPDDKSAARDT